MIGADGAMLGVMLTHEAMKLAQESGLDLVEVNPKTDPPVCKILDYGKFKYEEKKKAGEAKRKQTVVEIKEIKLRPKTDEHDYDVKLKHGRLADVAPTLLELMGLEQPKVMTGVSLIAKPT